MYMCIVGDHFRYNWKALSGTHTSAIPKCFPLKILDL